MVEQQLLAELNRVHIAYEFGSSEAIRSALLSGLGVSCLSRQVVARRLQDGSLTVIAPSSSIQRWFYIVEHRQRRESPSLARFVARCQALARA